MSYPLVPVRLPDGRMVWEEKGKARDVIESIRRHYPNYRLVRDFVTPAWDVMCVNSDGSQGRVFHHVGDDLPDAGVILAHIRAHDQANGYDPLDELVRREQARIAASDKAAAEIGEASADRMHYEFVDEFSAHMPAARPIFLNPATKRGRHRRAQR